MYVLRKPWGWERRVKTDVTETDCEDGRWMELAQVRVQWQVFILEEIKLQIRLEQN